jgi:hypothetical protein
MRWPRGLLAALVVVALIGCGGGGGGGGVVNDEAPPEPPPGGVGTGADGVPIFWRVFGYNVANGAANSLQQTSDGGFIAAGVQGAPGDLYVVKTDQNGVAQWERRIAIVGNTRAHAVHQITDGYMVAGTAGDTVVLVKLDPAGNTVAGWPKTYGQAGYEFAYAMLAVNGGADGYIVVGNADAGAAGTPDGVNIYVLRLNAAGSVLWQRFVEYPSFCPGGAEGGTAITATYDGNYVIAGTTGCSYWAGFLLKINGANGNEIWRRVFDDANVQLVVQLTSVIETADHSLIAAGLRGTDCGPTVSGTCDVLVIKTDSAGNEVWRKLWGGAQKDGAAGVALASDGSYLVAGYSHSYGGVIQDPNQAYQWEDVMLMKVAPGGATTWHKIKGLRPRGSDMANAVIATSDGGFAIGGSSGGNIMLAKFDKNGDTVNVGPNDLTINLPATIGVIDFNNAVELAGVGASGLLLPREVGGAMLDLLIGASGGDPVSAFCTGGGSYGFTPTVPSPLVVSGSYSLTVTNCVVGPAGDQIRVDGSGTLTVDAVSGAPGTPDYSLQITASNLALAIEDIGSTLSRTLSGGLRIARASTSANLADTVSSPAAVTLELTEFDGATVTRAASYGPFSIRYAAPAAGGLSVGQAGDTLTAAASSNTFAVSVLQPLALASSGAVPSSGTYRLTAVDNSRLTVAIASDSAELAVDTDGDGTDDGTLSVPWDFIY